MTEKHSRRLLRLEEIRAAAVRVKANAAVPERDVPGLIREHLKDCGWMPTGNESLAETMSRAFGINCHELRLLIAGPVEAFRGKLLSLPVCGASS